jgi:hypothetical protein
MQKSKWTIRAFSSSFILISLHYVQSSDFCVLWGNKEYAQFTLQYIENQDKFFKILFFYLFIRFVQNGTLSFKMVYKHVYGIA